MFNKLEWSKNDHHHPPVLRHHPSRRHGARRESDSHASLLASEPVILEPSTPSQRQDSQFRMRILSAVTDSKSFPHRASGPQCTAGLLLVLDNALHTSRYTPIARVGRGALPWHGTPAYRSTRLPALLIHSYTSIHYSYTHTPAYTTHTLTHQHTQRTGTPCHWPGISLPSAGIQHGYPARRGPQ
jgi:hypothetical protein